jgi:hypothetical protein
MSGTAAGQELAWTLLASSATLGVIGFTMDKPDIRLSNLMALDATAFGSWWPKLYRQARPGGPAQSRWRRSCAIRWWTARAYSRRHMAAGVRSSFLIRSS